MTYYTLASRLALILLVTVSLAGCGGFAQTTPTPLPTVSLDSGPAPQTPSSRGGAGVVASGIVTPAEQAELSFTFSGNVESVAVAVGDVVEAGQVLVSLRGKEDLLATISAAEYELAQAQKTLEDLQQNAGETRTLALERISAATEAVRTATYQLDNFTVPSSQANLETREALDLMESNLDAARAAFEPYRYYPSTNSTREDLKEKLDEAQAAYNAAVRRLQYETELEVAKAELADALQVFETWKEGPDPAELTVAEARLANARATLDAAQAKLDDLELRAPFPGTVAGIDVHSGEWVLPGQSILMLADLANLQVETTDLSERDIPRIEVGQTVAVFVKALNQEVAGRVIEIAPLADTLGGDVVYKTTVNLETMPPGLRAGMSVEVHFETD